MAEAGCCGVARRMVRVGARAGAAARGLALCALLAGCGARDAGAPIEFERPATAVDYAVELTGAPTEEIEALLRQSLNLYRRQEDGAASPAFLRRRALDDVDTARRVLRAFGYYEADATVEVAEGPEGAPLVRFAVEPGRAFTLAAHRFTMTEGGATPAPAPDAAALGSPVGGRAAAQAILDAEALAVVRLRNAGRPYARNDGREAVADMEAAEIEVETTIATGRDHVFGPLTVEGLNRVDEAYVRTWVPWEEGAVFDMRRLTEFQRDLVETNLFSLVSARPPEEAPESAELPVTLTLQEGRRRSVGAGLRFNTDTGPAARAFFEHRNLFGANETIRLEGTAGQEEQRLEARFRKPQYLRHRQDLMAGVGFRNLENDAFEETAVTAAAGLERRLDRRWTVGAGGLVEWSETTDDGVTTEYLLAGPTGFAAYDGTDDRLNPTKDARLRVDVTPLAGLSDDDGDTPVFVSVDGVGSAYLKFDEPGNHVLAVRGRLGSVIAQDASDVPAGRRLYSGGGGSVRGFAERSIGPENSRGDPAGGLSVAEAGIEMRSRFWGDIGGALFVEAGSVGEEIAPTFDEGVQVAAGGGVRYFSPIGPIRVDVGVPLNPRDSDDAFQLYLSIGQAF